MKKGEVASLVLHDHTSSNGATVKISSDIDV